MQTVSDGGDVVNDLEIAETALIDIAQEVAEFDPVLAPYLAIAVLALKGAESLEQILLSPAIASLYQWFLTLVTPNNSAATKAYIAAAQAAIQAGLPLNSPAAIAQWPILGQPFPGSVS